MAEETAGGSTDELILRIDAGVAYATINRPESRNALATPVRLALMDFVQRIKGDPAVRVLLLQATGAGFIAGGDVKAFGEGLKMPAEARGEDMGARAAGAGALCVALAELPQPVIVAARGPAVGVGASIVFAADLAILSETAKLRLSHVTLGISPDGAATWFLPRQVGLKRAGEIALLGDAVTAHEALAMGLVNRVVADAELEAAAEALARRLAIGAPAALAATKQLLRLSSGRDLASQVAAEADSLRGCAATADYAEGLAAILEKRAARFSGA